MRHKLNFEDTKIAFSLKSNKEVKWANVLFTIIGNRQLTAVARPITMFLLFIRFPIIPILKRTVFKQFCGGESILECKPVITNMFNKKKVCSILDYSIEGKESEEQFNFTLNIILKTFDFAKSLEATPFLVFKGTGLGRFGIFEKVSKKEALNAREREEWENIEARFDKICKQCSQTPNIKVMIDAEESWIQPAIDGLAEKMMSKYNKNRVVVFNTVQLYRWDRLEYLKMLNQKANKENHLVGIKLVRGAYMEKERERAAKKHYQSPICNNKQATDENFNKGVYYCLQNLNVFELFLGTHNELSSQLLVDLMNKAEIRHNDNRIWFGQLYGMGDHLSFNLADMGYNTAKYLPFGPVKEVIPYLLRRAEENTSVGAQTSRELYLIKKEIARRNKSTNNYMADRILS
ncbi:proline dehydrogenase family protein [Mariniflexile sp. HMF6888]|uniref:proline dehydrogenase family protein n=1 Tax=Mariniflexile sp. HMF6888 TaxID=3373086 RepID=UPI00378A4B2E